MYLNVVIKFPQQPIFTEKYFPKNKDVGYVMMRKTKITKQTYKQLIDSFKQWLIFYKT